MPSYSNSSLINSKYNVWDFKMLKVISTSHLTVGSSTNTISSGFTLLSRLYNSFYIFFGSMMLSCHPKFMNIVNASKLGFIYLSLFLCKGVKQVSLNQIFICRIKGLIIVGVLKPWDIVAIQVFM